MADLSELETRITAALDRIAGAVETLARPLPPPEPAPDPAQMTQAAPDADLAALTESLEAERAANAQLQERIRALKAGHEAELADATARFDDLYQQTVAVRERNRGLKRRLEEVHQMLEDVRTAGEGGITEPHLVNRAMMTELETLRSLRDSDRTELDVLLEQLKPLVEETADA